MYLVSVITFLICLLAFCFVDSFGPWRKAFVEFFKPLSKEEIANKEAEEAREAVLNQYYREFLAYGYSSEHARAFAIKKLRKEADAASGLSKEELR